MVLKAYPSRNSNFYHTNQEVHRQEVSQYCPPNIDSQVKVPQKGAKYLSCHFYPLCSTLF